MLLNDLGRGGKKGAVSKCGTCDGAGLVIRVHQIAPGMMQKIRAPCSDCAGQGEKINPKDKCKTCDGKKIIRDRRRSGWQMQQRSDLEANLTAFVMVLM